MYNCVFRVSCLIAIVATSAPSAFAADPLAPPPPPPIAEMRKSLTDWSGPYVGVAAGVSSLHSLYLPSVGNDPELGGDAVTFSGLVGYNLQYDNIVVGVEADITWADLKARNRLDEVDLEIPYIATARARLGYALDNTLIYATAGAGILEGKMTLTAFNQTDRKTQIGYVVGAGMETNIRDSLNLRLEYIYGDFGKKTYSFTPGDVNADLNSLHLVRAGLVYTFDPDG